MKAHEIKAWFKKTYGIPVRFKGGNKPSSYCGVWIASDRNDLHKLTYSHRFPDELGNEIMRIVYAGSEQLCAQNWGGNIEPHQIYMHPSQWAKFFAARGVSFD